MNSFKYLKKEGENYILPFQVSSAYFALAFCLGFAAFCAFRYFSGAANGGIFIFAGIFLGLGVMILMRMNSKIVFDPVSRTVTFPKLRNSEGRSLSFDQFLNFKLVKIKQNGLITVGNWLQMEFDINGKSKAFQIRQYPFGTKKIHNLVLEIEQVMGIDEDMPGFDLQRLQGK